MISVPVVNSNFNLCASGCRWDQEQFPGLPSRWNVTAHRLTSGLSAGVDVLDVQTETIKLRILVTRGLGIQDLWVGGKRVGWDSPQLGPVHPQWVELDGEGGTGWLRGFSEWFVRCGIDSNGAPEANHPLHGRIANLPAESLFLDFDESKQRIGIRGCVREAGLYKPAFLLEAKIEVDLSRPELQVKDKVYNLSSKVADMQMLYHINFGKPLLQKGSLVTAPLRELWPRDPQEKESILQWQQQTAPDSNYIHQVYLAFLQADAKGNTQVLLENPTRDFGFGIQFNIKQLPCFCIWKNLASEGDGYVIGLEPSTNFPFPKSVARKLKQTVELEPGKAWSSELTLRFLEGSKEVGEFRRATAILQKKPPKIHLEAFPLPEG